MEIQEIIYRRIKMPRVEYSNVGTLAANDEKILTVYGASEVVLIETSDDDPIDVSYYGALDGAVGFCKIGDKTVSTAGTVTSIDGNGCWEQIKIVNNSATVDADIHIAARWD
jgi:hypothetical protein